MRHLGAAGRAHRGLPLNQSSIPKWSSPFCTKHDRLTPAQDWQIALEVTNLTNRLYYDGIFDNRGSTQAIQGRPGRPREWAITLKRNF